MEIVMKLINKFLLLFAIGANCIQAMEKPDKERIYTPSEKKQCVYCPICNRIFKNFGGLDIHKPVHDMTRSFKCTICREGFMSENGLLIHKGTKAHKQKEAAAHKNPTALAAAELLLELSKKQA